MATFLSGMITTGFLVAALFFFRFWRRTGDTLFAIFGISFLLFAAGQSISVLADFLKEEKSWVYILRLIGFGLLLAAIARKNMGSKSRL